MEPTILTIIDWSLPIKNPVFLLCILLLTVLTVPALLQRYRLPGIVGLILAGALLGPHGINLLERGDGIKLLGTVGLLYIMFWAGLELNMASFIKNRHKSLVFGLLTFALPLTLGGFCAVAFLGYNWMGALLLAAMFSTHTLISYPIVNRLRISQNEAVATAVGGTIITDTLALLMLAVISGMAQGTMSGWFWVKLIVSLSVFGALVFGVLPRVSRWFFQRVESDITYQYVFVLATVFLCGLLAELAGVEAIIGAFMAGLVLNRLIPHSSALMNRIEFVGNALFIPAFLFSVGMLVNLHIFFKSEKTIVTALVLTAIALFTKWLAAFVTQKIFHYSTDQRNLIFGLSSSHAAATIAIVLIGYEIKLFDLEVLNAIIFLILVTCLVSSFTTDRVARKMAAFNLHTAVPGAEKTQRILVPYANPTSVVNLVDFAFLLKMPGNKEPVYPLYIILDDKDVREKIRRSQVLIEPVLQHAVERAIALSPIHRVDVSAVSGILRAANELLATEIVIGWHSKLTATEKLFGTMLDTLVEVAPEMVFVASLNRSVFGLKKVRAVLPERCHLEPGFNDLARRIENMALQLDVPLALATSSEVAAAFERLISKKTKARLKVALLEKSNWKHLHGQWSPDDLTIIVSARPEAVSYEAFMEKIPGYLTEHFDDKNFVMAYPAL